MELEYEEDIRKSLEKYFNGIGYKIADGANFGSDLVIYTKPGPNLSHSKYLLFIIDSKVTWREIISYYRVSSQTSKIALIAFKHQVFI
uniref:tRNA-intron lyase n=1 Tax=Theileria annulata TaxID=5874 RepID=A0A3B0MFA5_THEAN